MPMAADVPSRCPVQVASQPALAPPAGGSTGMQLGQAAVASAPGLGGPAAGDGASSRSLADRPGMRQRPSGGVGPKAEAQKAD